MASRALPGEARNGDGWLVTGPVGATAAARRTISSLEVGDGEPSTAGLRIDREGPTLLAVIDGTGHGPAAADAAGTIVRELTEHCDTDLVSLMRTCHASARGSRGAAVSLALIEPDQGRLRFVGVGNVTAQLLVPSSGARPSWTMLTRPAAVPATVITQTLVNTAGIVGHHLPGRLINDAVDFVPGNALVMFSDGVDAHFDASENPPGCHASLTAAARSTLTGFARRSDDATALVCGWGALE